MRSARIAILIVVLCNLLVFAARGQAQSIPSETIKKAFSLIGQWTIIKMDVSKQAFQRGNPKTPGAAAGQVVVNIGSSLADGFFEVHPDGTITGNGSALYRFAVSGGAVGIGPDPFMGLGGAIPVGASLALAADDDGKRAFNVSGQADLKNRTISLKAFQPTGSPLKTIISPGGAIHPVALWPPMTNVAPTAVVVEGASLLLRAAGAVGGMQVAIEAVKYVDLAGVFQAIVASCGCPPPQSGRSRNHSLSREPIVALSLTDGEQDSSVEQSDRTQADGRCSNEEVSTYRGD